MELFKNGRLKHDFWGTWYIDVHESQVMQSSDDVWSFVWYLGDILEIGAQWAIAKKDVDMFERYMAQLKCYYLDYRFPFIVCPVLSNSVILLCTICYWWLSNFKLLII